MLSQSRWLTLLFKSAKYLKKILYKSTDLIHNIKYRKWNFGENKFYKLYVRYKLTLNLLSMCIKVKNKINIKLPNQIMKLLNF